MSLTLPFKLSLDSSTFVGPYRGVGLQHFDFDWRGYVTANPYTRTITVSFTKHPELAKSGTLATPWDNIGQYNITNLNNGRRYPSGPSIQFQYSSGITFNYENNNAPVGDYSLLHGYTYAIGFVAGGTVVDGTYTQLGDGTTNIRMPIPVANPPTGVVATYSNGSIDLVWSSPNDGSATTNNYTVYLSNGQAVAQTRDTSCNLSNIFTHNTSYQFYVTTSNKGGTSSASSLSNAVTFYAVLSSPPRNGTSITTSTLASISWSPPINNGGSPIDYYSVFYNGNAMSPYHTHTSYAQGYLQPNTAYTYTVIAHNIVGNSAPLAITATTLGLVPDSPTLSSATPHNGSVTLSWTTPNDNGSDISGYVIYYGNTSYTVSGSNSATVSGLTNATSYTFRVKAQNAIGLSTNYSNSLSATPYSDPSAPSILSGVPGDESITLTCNVPSNNGSPITSYDVSYNGTVTNIPINSPITITGLTNGTPTSFSVAANNAAGRSPYSSPSLYTPYPAPSSPTVTATAGTNSVIVTLSVPNPFGSPNITYTIYDANETEIITNLTTTTITITDLLVGKSYQYKATATNAAGTGPISSLSNPAIPYDIQAPVLGANGGYSATTNSITLSWSHPPNPTTPISQYQIAIQYPSNQQSAILGGFNPDNMNPYVIVSESYEMINGYNTKLNYISGNSTSYTITGLNANTTYPIKLSYMYPDSIGSTSYGNMAISATTLETNPIPTPSAPTNLTATGNNGSVSLSWSAPGTGVSEITTYTVNLYDTNDNLIQTNSGLTGTQTTMTGLTSGISYQFKVTAVNQTVTGPSSALSSTIVLFSLPSAPRNGSSTVSGSSVSFSWSAPLDNGGGSIYYKILNNNVNNNDNVFTYTTTPSFTIISLPNTSHSFDIYSVNPYGESSPLTISATTYGVPTAPTNGRATVTATTIHFFFSPPLSNGGSPITGYRIHRWDDPVPSIAWGVTEGLLNCPPNTTYTIGIAAINALGDGPQLIISGTTPIADAPTNVLAVANSNSITVSWTAVPGLVYEVTDNTSNVTYPSSTSSVTITNLTNGTTYSYYVTGMTSDGEGLPSKIVSATPLAELAIFSNFVTSTTTETDIVNSLTTFKSALLGQSESLQIDSLTSAQISLFQNQPVSATISLISNAITSTVTQDNLYNVGLATLNTINSLNQLGNGEAVAYLSIALSSMPYLADYSVSLDLAGTASLLSYKSKVSATPPPTIRWIIPNYTNGIVRLPPQETNFYISFVPNMEYKVINPNDDYVYMTYNNVIEKLLVSPARFMSGTPYDLDQGIPIGAYTYTIFTVGSAGASSSNDVTNVSSVTYSDNNSATVSWSNPTVPPGPSYSIRVTATINGAPSTYNVSSSTNTLTITGIANALVSFKVQVANNGAFTVGQTSNTVKIGNPNYVPCFPKGTRLLTATGYKLVEAIEQGELVVTSDGRRVPVVVRSRTIEETDKHSAPYTIPKSSLAPNVPSHTVRLSPNHAIQLRKGLWMLPFAAAKLGNTNVVQESIGEPVTYYHFECPNYFTDNLVIEGGVVVESFGNKNIKKFPYTYNPSLKGFTRAAHATRITK
jgi:hypothetical protein